MRHLLFPAALVLFTAVALLPADDPKFSKWEKEIASIEAKLREAPREPIVFTGSSSIRLWDLAKSFPGVSLVNHGFGGSTIPDATHFAPRLVYPLKPKLVVFYSGDNDIANGRSPEQVANDFKLFVRNLHAVLPKTRLILLSVKPSHSRAAFAEKQAQANKLLADFCKSDSRLTFVDSGQPILGADGKPDAKFFEQDELHLNAAGYAQWAEVLGPLLR